MEQLTGKPRPVKTDRGLLVLHMVIYRIPPHPFHGKTYNIRDSETMKPRRGPGLSFVTRFESGKLLFSQWRFMISFKRTQMEEKFSIKKQKLTVTI